jgi:hypothetical protein
MVTARQLARAYDLSVASIWRGERPETTMIGWLGDFRVDDGFQEPESKPEAVSLLGGGGSGIRWYTTPAGVIGCTTGEPRVCYRVPLEADLPRETQTPTGAPVIPIEVIPATT